MIWLLKELKTDYRTIADFRKDNLTVLKNAFKHFSLFCNELGLYGKEIIAIDGSKKYRRTYLGYLERTPISTAIYSQ